MSPQIKVMVAELRSFPNKQLQLRDRRSYQLSRDVPLRPSIVENGSNESACHVYAAQFSKSSAGGAGVIAAGGSCLNELKLFDRASLAPLGRLTLPRGVYGLDLSHDGRSVAVAGGDCKVRVLRVPGASPAGAPTSAVAAAPVGAKAEEPVGLA